MNTSWVLPPPAASLRCKLVSRLVSLRFPRWQGLVCATSNKTEQFSSEQGAPSVAFHAAGKGARTPTWAHRPLLRICSKLLLASFRVYPVRKSLRRTGRDTSLLSVLRDTQTERCSQY